MAAGAWLSFSKDFQGITEEGRLLLSLARLLMICFGLITSGMGGR